MAEDVLIDPPKAVPEDALDRLFHGPLEEFTSARNELAKSLRSDRGSRGGRLGEVPAQALRRAWLVNQLATGRTRSAGCSRWAGSSARRRRMLAGATDREKLRETARREQEAVDSSRTCGCDRARARGQGPDPHRVGRDRQAAAGDPELAEAIGEAG